MTKIANLFSTIFVFICIGIGIAFYYGMKPAEFKKAEGFVLSIERKAAWGKRCYALEVAVPGIKKEFELGKPLLKTPKTIRFILCEKNKSQIQVVEQAMAESKKLCIGYIDTRYNWQKEAKTAEFTVTHLTLIP